MIDEDFKLYLPKYLSAESEAELLSDLNSYPNNINSRIYGQPLGYDDLILQGDGLNDLLLIDLPDLTSKEGRAVVLSNTCDVDIRNQRKFESRLCYSPLVNLEKYKTRLLENNNLEGVENHINSIREQKITQIFYFPKGERLEYEALIFFDRMCSCKRASITTESISARKIFTLSNYGIYVFLFKLSVHFTRIRESIDRSS